MPGKPSPRLDNRRSNLRICTQAQNCCNQRLKSRNKSGFKGVYWRKTKWIASIRINGRTTWLGSAKTPEEAADIYDKAARHYYGEFALLNKPLA